MNLDQMLSAALRWWWLLLVTTILAGISGYFVVQNQPEVYEARAVLLVGTAIVDPNPASGDIYLGQQLAAIYAEIGKRDAILDLARNTLGLESLPEVSVRAIPNSQFIEITVRDTQPLRAQAVANEIGRQIINRSPTSATQEDANRQEFIERQLAYLETKIEETNDAIVDVQFQLADLSSAREISDAQAEINSLQAKLLTLQANYAALLDDSREGAANRIDFIEEADVPSTSADRNDRLYIGLSASLGFVLGVAGILLVEKIESPGYSQQEIEKELDLPIIGSIPNSYELFESSEAHREIHVLEEPGSPVSEAFHLIRTNLQLSWDEKPPQTLLVSSFTIGAGKSTIAENLAAGFVLSGFPTILVDADFRRPVLHSRYGLPDGPGLIEVIEENLSPEALAHSFEDSRLKVLTNGSKSVDPVGFLSSIRFLSALGKLKSEASLAILDGPPTVVSDAFIMASKVDGVILVVNPSDINLRSAKEDLLQLERSGAKIFGLVLNKVEREQVRQYAEVTKHQYLWRDTKDSKTETSEKDEDEWRAVVPPFADHDLDD